MRVGEKNNQFYPTECRNLLGMSKTVIS